MNGHKQDYSYFGVQAAWGVTKHMGGLGTTDELASLCRIDKDKRILEVGCGTGVSSCYLAKKYSCHVTGVDISERMIKWARKRASRKPIENRVQFMTGDAQNLPLEDDSFDAVICESVTVFAEDPQKAVDEYVRVTKPCGFVGLNEGTWVKESPPAGLVEYVYRTIAGARPLHAEGWKAILETAHLTEIYSKTYQMFPISQFLDELQGLDVQDQFDRLRGIKDFVQLYVHNPEFRRYAKEISPSVRMIRDLFTYLGYGLYVGRKTV